MNIRSGFPPVVGLRSIACRVNGKASSDPDHAPTASFPPRPRTGCDAGQRRCAGPGLQLLAAGRCRAQGGGRRARRASPSSCPRPAGPTCSSKKIMVVIGEVQSDGVHRRAAAELRPALRGDQRAAALARACATYTPEEIRRADRAGGDRRVFPQRPRRRARRVEAARRELRAARADHGAGDAQPDDGGQPGLGEHGLHAHRQQRQADLRRPAPTAPRTRAPTSGAWR